MADKLNIRRMTGRNDCGNCYRPFFPFEIVHYLGIDNDTYCTQCREKLAPGREDDHNNSYGGWVRSLYFGKYQDRRDNVLALIDLFNKNRDRWEQPIEIKGP